MPDKISREKRSEIMSHIKGKDTSIEVSVRHWLYHNGIRYRKNSKKITGSPDISIQKYKLAIFINGCFWHGHDGCKNFRLPKSNEKFWKNKINRNIERDNENYAKLDKEDWLVIVIWECNLKHDFNGEMEKLLVAITDRMKVVQNRKSSHFRNRA